MTEHVTVRISCRSRGIERITDIGFVDLKGLRNVAVQLSFCKEC